MRIVIFQFLASITGVQSFTGLGGVRGFASRGSRTPGYSISLRLKEYPKMMYLGLG